ncbi:MAG: magnesium/cobalt transporter CorA [Betaproteobacteria bacterium]|nr:magnesium/cobalt transporter CorA [Betaproteobacteria bacterium]
MSERGETPMVVNCVAYRDGTRLRDITVEEISDYMAQPGAFVWLGLYEPDEQLMRDVQKEFGLHDLAVEDAWRAHQRPKLEAYGDTLFVVLRTARMEKGELLFGETHVFVGPRYVVTVRHGASSAYTDVRTRCEYSPDLLARGPGFILYAVLDFVMDQYFPIVEDLEDELEAIEEGVFRSHTDAEHVENTYELKLKMMAVRRAVLPVVQICNDVPLYRSLIADEIRPYFRDVSDHAHSILEVVESGRDMVNTALTVNLTLLSMRHNEVMKRLAGWAAILAIPTMIGGIYGMNFEHMPELGWTFGYPLTLGVMVVICVLVYRRLKRTGWL